MGKQEKKITKHEVTIEHNLILFRLYNMYISND